MSGGLGGFGSLESTFEDLELKLADFVVNLTGLKLGFPLLDDTKGLLDPLPPDSPPGVPLSDLDRDKLGGVCGRFLKLGKAMLCLSKVVVMTSNYLCNQNFATR